MPVVAVRLTLDAETCERLVARAKRYQKTMNLVVVEACRHLVGEEQRGKDPGDNGVRPETIKGGPRDPSQLPGWPSPELLFSIGEKTHNLVAREARRRARSIEDEIVAALLVWFDQPNPLSRW